jgi:SHS2 domain-containing protein
LSGWEHFPHEADVGIRGWGATLEEAFAQAALAMTAAVTDPSRVLARDAVEVECEAADHEQLLYDWLNALVYEMAARRMLFGRFEIRVRNGKLEAKAWGEPVSVAKHRPTVEVKGATYTELDVAQRSDGIWVAQCVIDV